MLTALFLAFLAQTPPADPAASSSAAALVDAGYTIGAGDVLKVKVFGYDDLTQSVVVQPDGTFTFPLLGAVRAADKTASDLARHMQARLADGFVRNPQVAVVLEEVRSKRVFVVGEIARPGAYPVSDRTTLVEILARSGPLTANAGSEIVVVRRGADVPREGSPPAAPGERVTVDVSRLQAGDMSQTTSATRVGSPRWLSRKARNAATQAFPLPGVAKITGLSARSMSMNTVT